MKPQNKTPRKPACRHKNLSDDIEASTVDYCPKGCDGATVVDGSVFCTDCGKVVYEIHFGHEGCRYGRG